MISAADVGLERAVVVGQVGQGVGTSAIAPFLPGDRVSFDPVELFNASSTRAAPSRCSSRAGHILVGHHLDRPPLLLQLRADAGVRRAVRRRPGRGAAQAHLPGPVVVPLGGAGHVPVRPPHHLRAGDEQRRRLLQRPAAAPPSSPACSSASPCSSTSGASSGGPRRSIIGSAEAVANGGEAEPRATPELAKKRGARASRTNTFFSFTMLWFMVFAAHGAGFWGTDGTVVGGTIVYWLFVLILWAFVEAQRPRPHRRPRQPVQQAGLRRPQEDDHLRLRLPGRHLHHRLGAAAPGLRLRHRPRRHSTVRVPSMPAPRWPATSQ